MTCEFVDAMYVNFAVPENVADGFDRGTYIFTAGLVVSMWISKYGSQMLKKIFPDSSAQTEEGKKLILVRLASVLTLFATCAATLVTFGLPTSLLFSFGGLGGLAFGLAAKDFIANLIGASSSPSLHRLVKAIRSSCWGLVVSSGAQILQKSVNTESKRLAGTLRC